MPYAQVNDINMYYEEAGRGQPLILLHGATGCLEKSAFGWGDLINLLQEKYRTFHIEHRGHGRTNNPSDYLTYELIADDIGKFIEHMKLGPTHIAGMSDGAIVALHIGIHRPDLIHTLICVGANYYNDENVKEANKFFDDPEKVEHEKPELAAEYIKYHSRNKHPDYWKTLFAHLAVNLSKNPNYTIKDLQKIAAPTLLIAGENDLWANRQQMLDMRKHIPLSEMLIVNNAEHEVQHTHAHIVNPQIMDFLDRHRTLKQVVRL